MVKRHGNLNHTIESVHKAMKYARVKLKNAAVLRNITDLRPIMNNDTRWSGKHDILLRLKSISEELTPIATTTIVTYKWMKQKSLRRSQRDTWKCCLKLISLASCRGDLDALMEVIEFARTNVVSLLNSCKLGSNYISPSANIMPNPIFECAVIKVQNKNVSSLTTDGKNSVSNLRREIEPTSICSSSSSILTTIEQHLGKKRKVQCKNDDFINWDFIVGSLAEVERL